MSPDHVAWAIVSAFCAMYGYVLGRSDGKHREFMRWIKVQTLASKAEIPNMTKEAIDAYYLALQRASDIQP